MLCSSHGHGTSSWPSPSGKPTECSTDEVAVLAEHVERRWPMRVMMRIETATRARSCQLDADVEIGEPSGPIENGTTYIVRPAIEPRKRTVSVSRISEGSRQLFVGPAAVSSSEQMKVRSSTRATSPGSERAM